MHIDIFKFFDFETAFWEQTSTGMILYFVWVTSKMTGEIFELAFDDEYFDMLLRQMELNLESKIDLLNDYRMGRY